MNSFFWIRALVFRHKGQSFAYFCSAIYGAEWDSCAWIKEIFEVELQCAPTTSNQKGSAVLWIPYFEWQECFFNATMCATMESNWSLTFFQWFWWMLREKCSPTRRQNFSQVPQTNCAVPWTDSQVRQRRCQDWTVASVDFLAVLVFAKWHCMRLDSLAFFSAHRWVRLSKDLFKSCHNFFASSNYSAGTVGMVHLCTWRNQRAWTSRHQSADAEQAGCLNCSCCHQWSTTSSRHLVRNNFRVPRL